MSTPSAEKSDPALWKRIVAKVKRGTRGGDAGQWSARKAQLATAEYQKAGGGYAGGRREDTHLAQWGAEHQGDGPAARPKQGAKAASARQAKAGSAKDGAARKPAAKPRNGPARKPAATGKGSPARGAAAPSSATSEAPRKRAAGTAAKPASKADPVIAEFRRLVNMSRTALTRWLATKRSREVGFRKEGATESVGHQSGQRIVELLAKKPTDAHSAEERAHMRKVIGYIKRHSAQRPEGEVKDTVWRASLMNWGHDPLKG